MKITALRLACIAAFTSITALTPAVNAENYTEEGRTASVNKTGTRMLTSPAVSDKHIAFSYDRDLWIADRNGKNPRRLTSHEGVELSPRFSPDGKMIAFSASYDGNRDVYIMPVSGGMPKRLTFHPSADTVEGFSPDGKSVLFSSGRNLHTNRHRKLFTIPVGGGFPKQIEIPNGLRGSFNSDGSKIAYIPISERFFQWKNYRGGTTSRVWIYDFKSKDVQIVRQPKGRCNDTDPVFIGDKVYFRSDRNGEFNLFSFDPKSEAIKQLTHFDDFHVARVTESKNSIIFEQGGYLHLFDPKTEKHQQLNVKVSSDLTELRPRYASGSNNIRNLDISPSGKRAVAEFRGEIVTVPASKGDVRNLTNTTGAHERSPTWSPDGKSIAYFSDESGEYKLRIVPQNGKGKAKEYKIQGHGFFTDLQWSPDGTKLSYCDNSWSLYIFDIAKKSSTKVASARFYGPGFARGLNCNWSSDSRWITYCNDTKARMQRAYVYNLDEEKSYPISDGLSHVTNPIFDSSGKYLYYLSSTDAGPRQNWFAQSNNDMQVTNRPYIVVLQEKGDNPLAPSQDEEVVEGGKTKKKEEAKKPGKKKLKIDFDGIDQRILALPLPAQSYSNMVPGTDGTIYYIKSDTAGNRSLAMFSLKAKKETSLMSGAAGFVLSADKKKILYVAGGGYGIAAAGSKISPGSGRLPVSKIRVLIDPKKEWQQIYDEVWRINRDFFYDPNMHGCNWPEMKKKYQQFIPHCVTRNDLNRVLTWICSEIAVGHHRVGGGDVRPQTSSVPTGLLGADFKVKNNLFQFKKVFGGLNWNGSLRSPLTEPGVRVKAGEYLFEVDGKPVSGSDNLYSHFVHKAGVSVELKVGSKADQSDARTVTVVPLSSEAALRNRDWIEGNLKRVHEATDGKVAYVYVPNTAGAGHRYFKRYFFPQVDKQAIIIDERYNGGGQIADYYLDHLRRPYVSHWATRYGSDFSSPTGTIHGPKVMLIDETAGSGGDMLPYMFDKLKMGTLVGRRTWGGLVGVLGFPTLMDGGSVTAPNIAIWTEDGFIVENAGVPPHVEVEQFPKDMMSGRDPQLEKAIQIALKQLEENPPKKYKKPPYPIRSRNTKKK